MLTLDLAVNPRPQERAIVVMRGKRVHGFTPEKTAAFYQEFRWAVKAAGVHKPLAGPLRVVMRFWRKSTHAHRGDLTNVTKACEDAGNGFLWEDDSQIRELDVAFVEWGPKVKPRITIEVMQLSLSTEDLT